MFENADRGRARLRPSLDGSRRALVLQGSAGASPYHGRHFQTGSKLEAGGILAGTHRPSRPITDPSEATIRHPGFSLLSSFALQNLGEPSDNTQACGSMSLARLKVNASSGDNRSSGASPSCRLLRGTPGEGTRPTTASARRCRPGALTGRPTLFPRVRSSESEAKLPLPPFSHHSVTGPQPCDHAPPPLFSCISCISRFLLLRGYGL